MASVPSPPDKTLHLLAICIVACVTVPWTLFAQTDGPNRSVAGVYTVDARLGEHTVASQLEIERVGRGYRGRLTVPIDPPLYFALRSTEARGDTLAFATSSPGTSTRLIITRDALQGRLNLSGARTISLKGSRAEGASVSNDLREHFRHRPFDTDSISRPDRGEAFPTFTPDGQTLYFSAYGDDFTEQTIMVSRRQGQRWTRPDTASFSSPSTDRSPAISPDGRRLVFASRRPLPGETEPSDTYNLWSVVRDSVEAWTDPKPLTTVNSDASDYQPTISATGTLFFTSERAGSQDLYRSDVRAGAFQAPVPVGPPINSEHGEMSSFVSPDGRFLIFASAAARPGHVGNDDLYITYRREGRWSKPRNLGRSVNSFANEYGPSLSPDGTDLYFTSDRHPPANIYRVKLSTLPGFDE